MVRIQTVLSLCLQCFFQMSYSSFRIGQLSMTWLVELIERVAACNLLADAFPLLRCRGESARHPCQGTCFAGWFRSVTANLLGIMEKRSMISDSSFITPQLSCRLPTLRCRHRSQAVRTRPPREATADPLMKLATRWASWYN